MSNNKQNPLQQATFGAGCFWGAEAAFQEIKGVVHSQVGLARSEEINSPWIEVVQVDFDPNETHYNELLALFWKIHDPLSVDKQGHDIGEKYRSAIFTHSDEQTQLAILSKQQLQNEHYPNQAIVTVVTPLYEFELADEKDQNYIQKHGAGACSI